MGEFGGRWMDWVVGMGVGSKRVGHQYRNIVDGQIRANHGSLPNLSLGEEGIFLIVWTSRACCLNVGAAT